MNLLFSFAGRIGRGKFWLGFLAQILLLLIAIATAAFLIPWDQIATLGPDGQPVTDAAGNPQINWGAMSSAFIVGAIWLVLGTWWAMAVAAKRCHDRGKSAWWLLIFAPSYLAAIATYWMMYENSADFAALATDGTFWIVQLVSYVTGLIAFIWWLVDLGILEGEEGENRWGPNPVPQSA